VKNRELWERLDAARSSQQRRRGAANVAEPILRSTDARRRGGTGDPRAMAEDLRAERGRAADGACGNQPCVLARALADRCACGLDRGAGLVAAVHRGRPPTATPRGGGKGR